MPKKDKNFFREDLVNPRHPVSVAELFGRVLNKAIEAPTDAEKAAFVRLWGTPLSRGGYRESRLRKLLTKGISSALHSRKVSAAEHAQMFALREKVCCAFADMARFTNDRVVANKLEAHSLEWNERFHLYETWEDAAKRRGLSKPGLLQLAPHYRRNRRKE